MIDRILFAIFTGVNIALVYIVIRTMTLVEIRHRLYSEEYLWLMTHNEYLSQRLGDNYSVFKRYRSLPSLFTMSLSVWIDVKKFQANIKPVRTYYDV
jgi:hypothetical protein